MSLSGRKILLVEDDQTLGETMKERLSKEGYVVNWSATYRDAIQSLNNGSWDLCVLDVGLPDGNGFDLARKVKSERNIPIVFVTAMNTAEYRLEGFEIGAEEYIPKPFHLKELLIRVRHVLENHTTRKEVVCGDLKVDLEAMAIVMKDGTKEFPQARDFRVLRFLIESAPRVVSRDDILNTVWGEDKFPSHRTVDNTIVRLRQLVGENFIRSVRGIGYQWNEGGVNE